MFLFKYVLCINVYAYRSDLSFRSVAIADTAWYTCHIKCFKKKPQKRIFWYKFPVHQLSLYHKVLKEKHFLANKKAAKRRGSEIPLRRVLNCNQTEIKKMQQLVVKDLISSLPSHYRFFRFHNNNFRNEEKKTILIFMFFLTRVKRYIIYRRHFIAFTLFFVSANGKQQFESSHKITFN